MTTSGGDELELELVAVEGDEDVVVAALARYLVRAFLEREGLPGSKAAPDEVAA